jgi:hypothetical protein
MSKRSRPLMIHAVLKPDSNKLEALIDPELEHQYEELLLLREKLKMATSLGQSETLSALPMWADRTSFAGSSTGVLDPQQNCRGQSAIEIAPVKRFVPKSSPCSARKGNKGTARRRSQKLLAKWF